MTEIQHRLDQLREEWKTADKRMRSIIEFKARILKTALIAKPVVLSMKEFKKPTANDIFRETVQENLLD